MARRFAAIMRLEDIVFDDLIKNQKLRYEEDHKELLAKFDRMKKRTAGIDKNAKKSLIRKRSSIMLLTTMGSSRNSD